VEWEEGRVMVTLEGPKPPLTPHHALPLLSQGGEREMVFKAPLVVIFLAAVVGGGWVVGVVVRQGF